MSNIFLVSKIQFFNATTASVDWVYGTDNNSIGGCTVIDLKEIPMVDRQSNQIVGEYIKSNLGESFFIEKDAELQTNQSVFESNHNKVEAQAVRIAELEGDK